MHRRYIGFVNALPLCDLLAFVHPKIGSDLKELADHCPNLIAAPTALYPELTFDFGQEERLQRSPIGFDLTGTLTRYRRAVMRKLGRRFWRCGYDRPVWRHVKFEESDPIAFGRSTIRSNYDSDAARDAVERDANKTGAIKTDAIKRYAIWRYSIGRYAIERYAVERYADERDAIETDADAGGERYLFNINPPQRARWQFSSPMRIARAAWLGQTPVVTAKFGDHEIEDIAYLWDGTLERAQQVLSFRMDRGPLLQAYRQSVQHYNAVAKEKNCPFIEALDLLLCKFD